MGVIVFISEPAFAEQIAPCLVQHQPRLKSRKRDSY
jgi:hypothetical protein